MSGVRFSMNSQEIWNMRFQGCRDQLQQLKQSIDLLKSQLRPRLQSEQKEELQSRANEITVQIALNSVEIINLTQFTDAKLQLTLEEANRTQLAQETLGGGDADKKMQQVHLSKDFKDLANEFKKIQKKISAIQIIPLDSHSDAAPAISNDTGADEGPVKVKAEGRAIRKSVEHIHIEVAQLKSSEKPNQQQLNTDRQQTDTFWQKKNTTAEGSDGKGDCNRKLLTNRYTLFAMFLFTVGIIALSVSSAGTNRRK